jgi:ATP-binding cassette, subfamily B, multidrug efflux pump
VNHLKALNPYFWKYRYRILGGVLFVLLANYFGVLQPRMIRFALDEVVSNLRVYPMLEGSHLQGDFRNYLGKELFSFGLLVIFFALMMGVFMFFMRWTLIVMSRLIEYDLRKDIYDHYQKLDTAFYKRNSTGDLMSRITEDISKVRMYLGPAILYAINLVFLFILVIQAMIQVNPELTFYSLLPLPILSVSIYYVSELINKKSTAIQAQLSRLTTIAQEVYSGIRVLKSYVQEPAMTRYFGDESEKFKAKSLELARVDSLFFPFMVLMIGVSTLLTIYIGGLFVFSGKITPGNIGEFVIYVNMLTWPVTSIGWVASIIQQASASQKRINEFLAVPPSIESGTLIPDSWDGSVAFESVSFTYPDTGIVAIKDLSFKLAQGQKLAVVGRTGSGKTTIAELIMRMYDVSSGRIEIGGHPLKMLDLGFLRSKVGYVPQDVFLFSDTIGGNIAFGGQTQEPAKIREAAEHAAIHEEIAQLPGQYDTLVGERGVTLSGGQKQRISLARALIKDASLFVLDDCLSAVDADTEKQVLDYIQHEMNEGSLLLITHRVTGLGAFDQILVMDQGEMIELGTHQELMALGGAYFEMVRQQTPDQEDEILD